MRTLQLMQIVGQATDTTWSQLVVLPLSHLSGKTLDISRGSLLVSLVVEGEDASTAGARYIHALEDLLTDGVLLHLTPSGLFADLKEIFSDLQGEVLVAYLKDSALVMIGYGNSRATLWRDGSLGSVFVGKDRAWHAIQGQIRENDRLLIGSSELVGEMTDELIDEVLADDILESGEGLVVQVQAADDSAGAAGLLLHVDQMKEVVLEDKLGEQKPLKQRIGANLLPRFFPRRKAALPPVFLRSGLKKKKTAFSVGVVLLVLLGVSVVLGSGKRKEEQLQASYDAFDQEITGLIEQAGYSASSDPSTLQPLFEDIQEKLVEAERVYADSPALLDRLAEKSQAVALTYERLSGEVVVDEIPLWFDVGLIREGMVGSALSLVDETLYVLDTAGGIVGRVEIGSKQSDLVAGGDLLAGSSLFDVSASRGVVLSDQGLIEISPANKTSAVLVDNDAELGDFVAVEAFGGSVYALQPGVGEIWKYPGLSRGVGDQSRWLAAGEAPDLSGAIDMVIDGDIWVLTADGSLQKFTQGAEESFELTGIVKPLTRADKVTTSDEITSLFILDRSSSRVVEVSKEGAYLRQLEWGGFSGVVDIAVDELGSYLYVLSGSSVYQIAL